MPIPNTLDRRVQPVANGATNAKAPKAAIAGPKKQRADTPRPRKPRTRTVPGPTVNDPAVREGEVDGSPVVFVGLSGRGYGREMILDAATWLMVADLWGQRWCLLHVGDGYEYVGSGRAAVARLAGGSGPRPVAFLGRLLTNAATDQVVGFENGNTLDLRAANLVVMPKTEARHWSPGMRAFLEHLQAG